MKYGYDLEAEGMQILFHCKKLKIKEMQKVKTHHILSPSRTFILSLSLSPSHYSYIYIYMYYIILWKDYENIQMVLRFWSAQNSCQYFRLLSP